MANTLTSVPVVALAAGYTTIYTVPAATIFTVAGIHLCNTTGAAVLVRACLVPTAGAPTSANALLWDFGISAYGVLELARGQIWADAGDTFQALGAGVSLFLSGIETT